MSLVQERIKLKQDNKSRSRNKKSKPILKPYQKWQSKYFKGAKTLRAIKRYIKKNKDLMDFWRGSLNEQLMISPGALDALKTYLITRMHQNLNYFEIEETEKLTNDTVIMFLYHKWILLALCEPFHLHPFCEESLTATNKPQFSTNRLDIKSFAIEILSQKSKKERMASGSYEEQLEKIKKTLKADFAKSIGMTLLKVALEDFKLNFYQAEEFITTANILIDIGNIIGVWDLCFISSVAVPFREENPFADINEWQRALRAESALSLIEKHYPENKHDRAFVNAMVVISLMRDSYVLSEKALNFVITKLNHPETVARAGGQLFVRFADADNLERDIFISPITEFYLRQYYWLSIEQNLTFELSNNLGESDFYHRIGKSKHTLKLETFKSWKHSIVSFLRLEGRLPGLMLAYFTGEFESHPLKPTPFNRVLNLPNPNVLENNHERSGFSPQNFAPNKRLPRSFLWSSLRKCLAIHHIPSNKAYAVYKDVQQEIQGIIVHPAIKPSEKLIAQYAKHLVDKQIADAELADEELVDEPPIQQTRLQKRIRTSIAPSVILTQIDAFGLPLIAVTDGQNIKKLSAHQRQAAYLDMLDIDGVDRSRVLYYLKFFEDWLVITFPTSLQRLEDYEELFGDVKRPTFKVDANILSFDDYQQALGRLVAASKQATDSDQALIFSQSALLLVMGFKLDLRRSEGLHLHGKDYFYDPSQPDLFIRPHEGRTLKTLNAKRFYHLEEHLDDHEIALFSAYFESQEIAYGQVPQYFFAKSISTTQTSQKLISVLMETLHRVTGDDSLKYHNLRHAKASWDMLSILNAQFDLKIEEAFFQHLPDTAKFLKQARSRWQQIVHNTYSVHKAHYHLKSIMGHGSFTTTLKNYIHTLDIAGAGFQHKKASDIMTVKWAVSQGVASKSNLYRQLANSPDRINRLLDALMPWFTSLSQPEPLSEPTSLEPQLVVTGVTQIDPYSLLPGHELDKLKPYCLFQLSLPLSPADQHRYLSTLGLGDEGLDKIREHFEQHTKFRMKPIREDESKKRLLQRLSQLPSSWLEAILKEDFFKDAEFIEPRKLIEAFNHRLSARMAKAQADQLQRVEAFDIMCHDYDQVSPILKLCQLIGVDYSFKFQQPKSQKCTLDDWRKALGWDQNLLPNTCIQKTTVLNPKGRLIIKLERKNKTRSKDLETYFLLLMLQSYQEFLLGSHL